MKPPPCPFKHQDPSEQVLRFTFMDEMGRITCAVCEAEGPTVQMYGVEAAGIPDSSICGTWSLDDPECPYDPSEALAAWAERAPSTETP